MSAKRTQKPGTSRPSQRSGPQHPRAASSSASLTDNDRSVLSALQAQDGQPVSAYDLIDSLRGGTIRYPATVYRALDRLIAAGLVHRIETSKAFVACNDGCGASQPLFAVCDECGQASELKTRSVPKLVHETVAAEGFEVTGMSLEVRGLCHQCRPAADRA